MQYVAYYRVSTKRQGESGLGLDAQRAIVRHFAGNAVLASYVDIASGKSMVNRAQLHLALEHCRRLKAGLVVAKADRLSRNVQDALSILDSLGGRLVCCDCPGTDRFTLTILFALAERERELISIRTRSALEAKRRREGRQKINGREKGADLSVARAAARLMREKKALERAQAPASYAEKWLARGCSLADIARQLNELGHVFPTPSGRGCWSACQVARALRRWEAEKNASRAPRMRERFGVGDSYKEKYIQWLPKYKIFVDSIISMC